MDEETVIFKGSSSLVLYCGRLFLGFLALAGAGALAVMKPEYRLAGLILAGVALVFMGVIWAINRSRVYEITTERIRLKTGILTRKTEELELYRVQDLTLVEPLSQRILGVGSIVAQTMDTTTPQVRIEAIRGAHEVREALRKNVEICRTRKGVRVAELE